MLRRAMVFSEKGQVSPSILTFDYNPDYDNLRKHLHDTGRITDQCQILNMYEFYQGERSTKTNTIMERGIEEPGCTADPTGKGRSAFRIYKNGLYIMYKSFNEHTGKLQFIDHFNENRYKTKREYYDSYGRLRKISYLDFLTGLCRQELFYTEDNRCFISKWFKVTANNKQKLDRIHWFDEEGKVKKVFGTEEEMSHYWLNYLSKNEDKLSFFIIDNEKVTPLFIDFNRKYNKKNVRSIFVVHSIHLNAPFEWNSSLRKPYLPLLENISEPDAIVFLTNTQRDDIVSRFGNVNNFSVIPHSCTCPNSIPSFSNRDLKKAIMLARLVSPKQIEHAIQAFKIVSQKVNGTTLEIYGFGAEEENLNKLIKKLELEGVVNLNNFVKNPKIIYEQAAFSVLTSKYEGFGLVILESLASGCPVISYDIKYGPSDMIKDDQNGFLIQPGNIEQLAERMIALFGNEEKLKQMSEQSYESAKQFNDDLFLERWFSLLNGLVNK